jgi:glycosyltransferase involved in cell wall biosynthesis
MVRRILSISHSYVVGLNRRLAHEMSRQKGWEVVAVAPSFFHGGKDLRPVRFAMEENEPCPVRVVPARMTRFVHGFWYSRALRDLLDQPVDIVHQWEEPYVVAGAQICRWAHPESRLVFWTAQNNAKEYPWPFSAFERSCLERASGWMACGETTRVTLNGLGRGYEHKPSRVMPLGVDLDVFRPDAEARGRVRRELGWDVDGPPVVGYFGRFVTEKGVSFLLDVLETLKGTGAEWRALFVGTGALQPRLDAFAQRIGGDRVRVCTNVNHDRIWAYINAADLVAAPSLTTPRWREQFGRMLVEAMACGLPVAGSDSGEIPFVLRDAGMILPEASLSQWCEGLGRMLHDPDLRKSLREKGLETVQAYAWPNIAARHLQFFAELCDASTGAG